MRNIFTVLCFLIIKGMSSQACFDLPASIPGITNTGATLAKGDFNSDGITDLVYGTNSSSITVVLGSATGLTGPGNSYPLSGNLGAITINDFNNDGKMDMVAVAGNTMSVLLGNGNGTFAPAVNSAVVSSLRNLISADFNNDGNKDLAMIFATWNYVFVLNGLGAGTFSTSVSYSVNSAPYGIAVDDFNSDGKPDIVTANYSTNDVSVLLNTGTGFASAINYLVGGLGPTDIISGDFNQDGNPDVAVAKNGTNTTNILLGSPTAVLSFSYVCSGGGQAILADDFNNDGKLDLAIEAVYGITVSLGAGNGSFIPGSTFSCYDLLFSMCSGDFNADSKTDLIICNAGSNNISLMLGNGNGKFIAPLNYGLIQNGSDLAIADFNNDGQLDFITANQSNVSLFLGSPTGTFSAATNFTIAPFGVILSSIAVADLNIDGKPDVVVTNRNSNEAVVLLNNSAGSFLAPVSYLVDYNPQDEVIADFNNDGTPDIVTVSNSGPTISVLLGTGTGTFGSAINYNTLYSATSLIAKDFNADGNIDLLCNTTHSDFAVLFGTGTGSFSAPVFFGASSSYNNFISSIDYNGDGKPDVATANSGTSFVSVFLAVGTGSFAPAINYNSNGTPLSILSTDINGDGKSDILTSNQGLSVMLGSGTGSFQAPVIYSVKKVTTVAGDFDHNGTLDLAGINLNYITVLFNNASSSFSLSTSTNPLCAGSSVTITATGGGPYNWSTGAIGNSIVVNPTTSSAYSATSTALGCNNVQFAVITVSATCQDVWPGDANSDGIVDNTDVLELALHFTQTGPSRATTSNTWQSYVSNNWTGTISNGKNVNHSDCNGDGTINNNDTLAIYNNYGLTHAFKENETTSVNPALSIVPDQPFVNKGNWGTASVFLGEASAPINNINGLAFTVTFDQNLIDANSFYIEYTSSFLNSSNQNLKFNKLNFTNGLLYTATTHTNNTNVSGNGKIAIIHYKIKSILATDAVLNIAVTQVKQSNANGTLTPLTSGSATIAAIGASVGMDEYGGENTIGIYPNPANNVVTIYSSAILEKIELCGITGQVILSEKTSGNQYQLDLSGVANGVYFVTITSQDKKVQRKKVVVQH